MDVAGGFEMTPTLGYLAILYFRGYFPHPNMGDDPKITMKYNTEVRAPVHPSTVCAILYPQTYTVTPRYTNTGFVQETQRCGTRPLLGPTKKLHKSLETVRAEGLAHVGLTYGCTKGVAQGETLNSRSGKRINRFR